MSDRAAIKIWVFDSMGRSLDAICRKGEGPGEIETPAGIAIGPDDRLCVRDLYFVSIFGADLTTGRISRYIDNFRGPLFADWRSSPGSGTRRQHTLATRSLRAPAASCPD